MAIRIRVFPQPGSIGAQRAAIQQKNHTIANLRSQLVQLRQQVAVLNSQALAAQQYVARPPVPPYGSPFQVPPTYGSPFGGAYSGVGQLYAPRQGGLFGGW